MNARSLLVTHTLPLWFLVFSLFLPRICIVVAWLQHSVVTYNPATVNLFEIIAAVLIPRILILFWIYQDQGIGLWFLIHAVALVFGGGRGGSRGVMRRRVVVREGWVP